MLRFHIPFLGWILTSFCCIICKLCETKTTLESRSLRRDLSTVNEKRKNVQDDIRANENVEVGSGTAEVVGEEENVGATQQPGQGPSAPKPPHSDRQMPGL